MSISIIDAFFQLPQYIDLGTFEQGADVPLQNWDIYFLAQSELLIQNSMCWAQNWWNEGLFYISIFSSLFLFEN